MPWVNHTRAHCSRQVLTATSCACLGLMDTMACFEGAVDAAAYHEAATETAPLLHRSKARAMTTVSPARPACNHHGTKATAATIATTATSTAHLQECCICWVQLWPLWQPHRHIIPLQVQQAAPPPPSPPPAAAAAHQPSKQASALQTTSSESGQQPEVSWGTTSP